MQSLTIGFCLLCDCQGLTLLIDKICIALLPNLLLVVLFERTQKTLFAYYQNAALQELF